MAGQNLGQASDTLFALYQRELKDAEDPNAMMAEIWGKKTGICKGMGGSMHVADLTKGILGANGIVGGGLAFRVAGTTIDEALRAAFAEVGNADRIVTYCAAGIAASADAFALTLLGHDNVAIYDGSLNEWAADPDAPLVVGA